MLSAKATKARRDWILENVLIIPIMAILVGFFTVYDHRPPIDIIDGQILPQHAKAGDTVTVRWHMNWRRPCAGTTSRQVVGSDLIVRSYLREKTRIPSQLGEQISDTEILLSKMLPPGLTAYRTVLQFQNCGIISHLWPIDISSPPIFFEIVPP